MIRPGIWRRELAVPLQTIQTELNRLFDEYWRPPGEADGAGGTSADPDLGAGSAATSPPSWTPAIDLWESAAELTLMIDLPGVDPASIHLSLAGNILTIRGEKLASSAPTVPNSAATAAPRGRIKERLAGTFHREVTLVEEVDFDRVEAQSKNGVLTVRLPRRAAGQPRTIPIQSAD